jgi:ankyrin repeat protein
VKNDSIQHVTLLASREPTPISLNRAFEAAMSSSSSIAFIEELIRYGVDPNSHSEKLMVLLRQRNTAFVEAFLRSPRPLQPIYLNIALAEAVGTGDVDNVTLLLSYGADPNYQGAEGFLATMRASDLKIACLLLVGTHDNVKLRSEYLDHAVSIVAQGRGTVRQRHESLNILLCAGASPNSKFVEDELFSAVGSSNMDTIKLLVSYGASVDHGEGRCFRAALDAEDLGLLEILLGGDTSPALLARAIPRAMAFRARDQRLQAMKLLLSKGARGSEVDQALVTAIQQEDSKLFNELQDVGADANHQEGLALEAALQARNPAFLQYLLQHISINLGTAARVVPLALDPRSYMEPRSGTIVTACRSHHGVLNKALTDEVATLGAREVIIKLLLDNGASVDASNGAALYQAALSGRHHTVNQLAKAGPSHLALHSAFRAAMSLNQVSSRFAIMKILLDKAGEQNIGQDEALIPEASNAAEMGTDIVELLVKHSASVDHQNGDAVKAAIRVRSITTLRILMSARPSTETLTAALAQCMALPIEDRTEYATLVAENAMHAHKALPVGLHLEQAIIENDVSLSKLLLHYGADPNNENGKAFIHAARLPDTRIFEELLICRPDIKRLLPSLIRELDSEEKVVACLRMCFERLQIQLHPSENVLLFLALDQFEQGDKLMRLLLDAGCPPGATRKLAVRPGEDVQPVTPLIWALSRPLPGPSRAVLLALLERGAEGKSNVFMLFLSLATGAW